MVLRSGGADGADSAFEKGALKAGHIMEIYLPWPGFQGRYDYCDINAMYAHPDAHKIASQYHPKWNMLKRGAQALHSRNVCQILGKNLKTPSKFVICYTPNGSGSGGTGQALRMARAYGIPVFDLGLYADYSDTDRIYSDLIVFINNAIKR